MWFAQAECLFGKYCYVVASLTHESMRRLSDLVEKRQDQDPYEVLKARLLSSGSSAGATDGCGQASAHRDSLHEGHQSGGPIWRPRRPLHSSCLFFNRVSHKDESGKHQLIMTTSMKVIRAVAPSGGTDGLYTAVASSSTEYGCLFAEHQDVAQHKEETGKHPLIMTASMKVIRAVAPSGGSGGLYTSVASSSTEYGRLFAEDQDVAQHKEEFPRPKHDVEHHLQTSGPPLTAKGRLQRAEQRRLQSTANSSKWGMPRHFRPPHHVVGSRRPRGRGLINPACSFLKRQQTEGDPCSRREKILQDNCT
jgi:hypothetical protein